MSLSLLTIGLLNRMELYPALLDILLINGYAPAEPIHPFREERQIGGPAS